MLLPRHHTRRDPFDDLFADTPVHWIILFVVIVVLGGILSMIPKHKHSFLRHLEEKRDASLMDHGKGYPVWFSWNVHDPEFLHLNLFIHGREYNLKLPGVSGELPTATSKSSHVPTWLGKPACKAQVVGWTRKEHEEVQCCIDEVMQTWDCDTVFKNCKPFVFGLLEHVVQDRNEFGCDLTKAVFNKQLVEVEDTSAIYCLERFLWVEYVSLVRALDVEGRRRDYQCRACLENRSSMFHQQSPREASKSLQ